MLLIVKVLECITRAKVSKMSVMQSVMKPLTTATASSFLFEKDKTPDTPLRRSVVSYIVRGYLARALISHELFFSLQDDCRRRIAALNHVELAFPGTLIQLIKPVGAVAVTRSCFGRSSGPQAPVAVLQDQSTLQDIVLVCGCFDIHLTCLCFLMMLRIFVGCVRACVLALFHLGMQDGGMAFDHFPDEYLRQLTLLAKSFDIDNI